MTHYRATYDEYGLRRRESFHASDLDAARLDIATRLAVYHPDAVLVSVTSAGGQSHDALDTFATDNGMSRLDAYSELHGEERE